MQSNFNSLSKLFTLKLLFFAFILIFSGCLKEEDVPEPVPVAYVSFFHGSPDGSELDIMVESNRITSQPFKYTNYSGFLNFYTGNRQLRFTSYNATNSLLDTTLNFQTSKAYSLFLINEASKLKTLVVQDNAEAPPTGKAFVRLIHLSPDAPEVNLSLGNTTNVFSQITFKEASAFVEVNPGKWSLQLKSADGNNELINLPEIIVQPDKRYTIVIRGFVNPPTGNNNNLSVQLIDN